MRASLLFIILLSSSLHAQVYRHVEPDGTVVFSDKHHNNSETVEIRPIQIVPATKIARKLMGKPSKEITNIGYTNLNISSPINNETIPNGAAGTFTITGVIKPALQNDHKVVLLVDGKHIDYSREGANFTLKNVDRGSHILRLQITDNNDEILKSSKSIDIHVQRAFKK